MFPITSLVVVAASTLRRVFAVRRLAAQLRTNTTLALKITLLARSTAVACDVDCSLTDVDDVAI